MAWIVTLPHHRLISNRTRVRAAPSLSERPDRSYCLSEGHWGHGLGSRALTPVEDYVDKVSYVDDAVPVQIGRARPAVSPAEEDCDEVGDETPP